MAGEKFICWLESFHSEEWLIAGISGGGSSLMEYPDPIFSKEEVKNLNAILVQSGANILEINSLRYLVSDIKMGKCLKYFKGKGIIQFIVSDIPESDFLLTSSSPFQRLSFINQKNLIENLLRGDLRDKLLKKLQESEDNIDVTVKSFLLADYHLLIEKIKNNIKNEGLVINEKPFHESYLTGSEKIINEIKNRDKFFHFSFGELNVDVKNKGGIGGRNTHWVLYMAIKIFKENILNLNDKSLQNIIIGSFATDGDDGVSKSSGAIIDYDRYLKAIEYKYEPSTYLNDDNSALFFEKIGGLIPSHNSSFNLMDVRFIFKN